jgi:hypothetical protein
VVQELGTPETAAEDKALQDELAKLKKAIAESIMRQEEELQALSCGLPENAARLGKKSRLAVNSYL